MQHVIIGTAGHIDHGKTTLIKALTGRETDTLREEKERGISINLGFTYFDLASGKRAGIVDVPGHEKFIKNALAGIGGIDLVLLVIAADEGIMPQTREHLNILELLDIKNGIVVITKADLVDDEWLEMVTAEIKKEIGSTFLKDSPIIPVDSISKRGMKELSETIDQLTSQIKDRDIVSDFRIPVDRVFTISGFGTVITGTLISGTVANGDPCEIFTSGIKTKIRNIQVHEQNVEKAYSGQRVAINLANIKTGEIERGDVIARIDALKASMMIDCRLKYLKDAPRPLSNRDRVRVYHGTSELLGRVVILDKEDVKPGESALIQIRLEKDIAAKRGDKFVIRSYSPLFTIGGGTILDPNPKKHKLSDKTVIDELLIKEKGTPEELLEQAIKKLSAKYPKKDEILKLTGISQENFTDMVNTLIESKTVIKLDFADGSIYLHSSYVTRIINKTEEILTEYHKNNSLKAGISREEFKAKIVGTEIKQKVYDKLIELLMVDFINAEGNFIWLKDFEIKFNNRQEEIKNNIIKVLQDNGFAPPKPEDILKVFGREEKAAKMVFDCLVDMGVVVKIADDIYITKENVMKAKEIVMDTIENTNELSAAQFRDAINASRKYAVAILEYFDAIKLTKRVEDKRILF